MKHQIGETGWLSDDTLDYRAGLPKVWGREFKSREVAQRQKTM